MVVANLKSAVCTKWAAFYYDSKLSVPGQAEVLRCRNKSFWGRSKGRVVSFISSYRNGWVVGLSRTPYPKSFLSETLLFLCCFKSEPKPFSLINL